MVATREIRLREPRKKTLLERGTSVLSGRKGQKKKLEYVKSWQQDRDAGYGKSGGRDAIGACGLEGSGPRDVELGLGNRDRVSPAILKWKRQTWAEKRAPRIRRIRDSCPQGDTERAQGLECRRPQC